MKVVREIVPREKVDMINNLLESIANEKNKECCNINTVIEEKVVDKLAE